MVYLKVKENTAQAKLMIEYLKTLSFVEVIENENVVLGRLKAKKENVPNLTTRKAMKEAEKGIVTKSKNVKDLISKLKS